MAVKQGHPSGGLLFVAFSIATWLNKRRDVCPQSSYLLQINRPAKAEALICAPRRAKCGQVFVPVRLQKLISLNETDAAPKCTVHVSSVQLNALKVQSNDIKLAAKSRLWKNNITVQCLVWTAKDSPTPT